MAISTYIELQSAVSNWIHRNDLSDRIKEFIAMAEGRITVDVRVREMETRTSGLTIATEYGPLPTQYLAMRNVQLNTDPKRRLRYFTPEQIDTQYPQNDTGKPSAYTIIGNEIQVRPIPDASYEIEYAYYKSFDPLATTSTNWLLTNHPLIYLYASLAAAELYLMNDERLAAWEGMYDKAVGTLNDSEREGRYSGSALMVRNDSGTP